MVKPIKVIDLFAGPGGLGEGFSSFKNKKGEYPFNISLSIEKEKSAHRTLLLRSFFRQFKNNVPDEYYDFLKGNLGNQPEDILYKLRKFENEVINAQNEAQLLCLGEDNRKINSAIRSVIGNDECVIIGGPPCQAYSLAGRARNKGIIGYKIEEDPRNYLYIEYLKIIALFQPIVFVMENVEGILSARNNGNSIFDKISSDLHNPAKASNTNPEYGRHEYRLFPFTQTATQSCDLFNKINSQKEITNPKDYIIRTELYSVPQRRHRVILLGIREDYADKWHNKLFLQQLDYEITIKDVLNDLPALRSGLSRINNTFPNWHNVLQTSKKHIIPAVKESGYADVAKRMKNIVSIIKNPKANIGSNLGTKKSRNLKLRNTKLKNWYIDPMLDNYICNHESRTHLNEDIYRYLFCSSWSQIAKNDNSMNPFPKSSDFPAALRPSHKNFCTGNFADRFRVQIENKPATTITSHISKDGHYYIHYDPSQCRSLTVREAARIQTFPDNYFFVGNRTEQYIQVGNAVPPYLAKQLAQIIYKLLFGSK